MGSLATYILDHRIPIECCLQSNLHTGAVKSIKEHPFPYLLRQGYRVTLNTDNRLMSHTTMTDEFRVAVEQFGCTLDDLERVTVNAMNAAFFPYANATGSSMSGSHPAYARAESRSSRVERGPVPPRSVRLQGRGGDAPLRERCPEG